MLPLCRRLLIIPPKVACSHLGAEPNFVLPGSYKLSQSLVPALTKLSSFTDETLFYIFYSMPRDVLQEAAAQELYSRSWRFHKEFKLWLCKDPNSEPVKGQGFERGFYIFFDPSSWSCVKKEWVLHYHQLEERVLAIDAQGNKKKDDKDPSLSFANILTQGSN